MNNPYMWHAIKNICLFALIGGTVYITESAWPLFGLMFVSQLTVGDKEDKKP